MSNWNSTFGFVGFNNGEDALYRSASLVARGAATGFTAVIAVQIREPQSERKWLVGNELDAGWSIARAADEAPTSDSQGTVVFEFRIRASAGVYATASISINKDTVYGRTALLALQVDAGGSVVSAWLNGAFVASAVLASGTIAPATIPLAVGNEPDTGLPGTTDRIIAVGYTPTILTEAQMAALFEGFRQLGTLTQPGVYAFGGFTNVWDFINGDTPTTPAPARIPGTGSNTTALVYQSTTAALEGVTDLDPDFVSGVSTSSSVDPNTPAINVYMSNANGSDANDGLTPATPVQTFDRVWSLLPTYQTSPFVVHMDGGSAATLTTQYVWGSPPKNVQIGEDAIIVVYGDGAGQATNDGFFVVTDAVARTVTGASTSNALTITGGGATVNAYRDMTLEMTSGTAAGQRRSIVANTATQIFLSEGFCDVAGTTFTPSDGDTFRIIRPNTVLRLSAGEQDALQIEGVVIHFINVALNHPSSLAARFLGGTPSVFGIELRNDTRFLLEGTSLFAGCAAWSATGLFGRPIRRPDTAQQNWRQISRALGQTASERDSGDWDGWGITQVRGLNSYILFDWNELGVGYDYTLTGFVTGGALTVSNGGSVYLYGCGIASAFAVGESHISINTSTLDGVVTAQLAIDNTGGPSRSLLGASGPGATIEIGYYSVAATLTLTQTLGGSVITATQAGEIVSHLTIAATTTGTQGIQVLDGAVVSLGSTSLTGATTDAFTVGDGGKLTLSGNTTLSSTSSNQIYADGVVIFDGVLGQITSTGGSAIVMRSGARFQHYAGDLIINGGGTGNVGAVDMSDVGTCFNQAANALSLAITNTNVVAGASGLRAINGAQLKGRGGAACFIGTLGAASSYGVYLQSGGRAIFETQPTAVAGDAAGRDFRIDATDSADVLGGANTAVTGAGASMAVWRV